MQLLFDFFPILFFFIAYKFYGVYVATAVAMMSTLIQVGLQALLNKRVEKMPIITLLILIFLGGATLLFHDERFIKWKPTAIYWVFAIAFIGSHYLGDKLLIKRIMGDKINLPAILWKRLNVSWILFFSLMGAVNLWVAYQFSTNTWVNFKLFGILGLMLLFTLLQGLYIAQHLKEEEPTKEEDKKNLLNNNNVNI